MSQAALWTFGVDLTVRPHQPLHYVITVNLQWATLHPKPRETLPPEPSKAPLYLIMSDNTRRESLG